MENKISNVTHEDCLYNLIHDDHNLYLEAQAAREQKLAQIQIIEGRIASLPQGGFSCRVNGDRFKCYRVHESIRRNGDNLQSEKVHRKRVRHEYEYLPLSDMPTIRQLALRKLLQLRLDDLNNEVKAIDKYLSNFQRRCRNADQFYSSPGISGFVDPLINDNEKITEWQSADYKQSEYRVEDRNIPTIGGINVRSKSEALIANILYERGIPFRYECIQTIGQRAYAPDFTILNPLNGREIIWEHFGMMDSADYLAEYGSKISRYLSSGYLPYRNLITTYETRENPFDVHAANRIVKMMFGR